MSEVMPQIEEMLLRTVGFDREALSSKVVRQCVQGRMFLLGIQRAEEYLALLRRDSEELDDLVNTVVVPETWFFRDQAPFEFLRYYLREEWLARSHPHPLRILSIPCSTGEEPYSIAMALDDLSLDRSQYRIDAVDISQRALDRARQGLYQRNSFRGTPQAGLMRFFEEIPGGFQLNDEIRSAVHFIRANAMTFAAGVPDASYDIIFCRNLLIYLDEKSRQVLVSQLVRALVPEGLFFLGHAEAPCIFLPAYEAVPFPGAFAVRKRVPVRRIVAATMAPFVARPPAAAVKTVVTSPLPMPSLPVPTASVDQLMRQARQCADRGEYAQARRCCEEVLKKQPFCSQAFYLSGVAALAIGDEQRALEYFHKTLYLEPFHEEALLHVSLLMEKAGERTQAARYRQMLDRQTEAGQVQGRKS